MRHITANNGGIPTALVVAIYAEGAILSVPPELGEYSEPIPPDLVALLLQAQEAGCYLVRLDRDGDFIPGLYRYDW